MHTHTIWAVGSTPGPTFSWGNDVLHLPNNLTWCWLFPHACAPINLVSTLPQQLDFVSPAIAIKIPYWIELVKLYG